MLQHHLLFTTGMTDPEGETLLTFPSKLLTTWTDKCKHTLSSVDRLFEESSDRGGEDFVSQKA